MLAQLCTVHQGSNTVHQGNDALLCIPELRCSALYRQQCCLCTVLCSDALFALCSDALSALRCTAMLCTVLCCTVLYSDATLLYTVRPLLALSAAAVAAPPPFIGNLRAASDWSPIGCLQPDVTLTWEPWNFGLDGARSRAASSRPGQRHLCPECSRYSDGL